MAETGSSPGSSMTWPPGSWRLPYRQRGFDCMCGNLRMASRAVTSVYDAHLAPSGLTSNQLAVLWPIVAIEPVPMSEIARWIVMDKTTVSRNVAVMVNGELVVPTAPGVGEVITTTGTRCSGSTWMYAADVVAATPISS